MLQAATADARKTASRRNARPLSASSAQALRQASPVTGLSNQATLRLMRKCDCGGAPDCDCDMGNDKKKKETDSPKTGLHRAAASPSAPETVPPIVGETLRSPGQTLDPETRAFFEARFGQDFSGVRIHADARSAQSALAVNALAYTVGSHLAFAPGRFAPRTPDGRRLLAHELTHVVQQHGDTASRISSPGEPAEQEAASAERASESGEASPSVSSTAPALQRDTPDEFKNKLGSTPDQKKAITARFAEPVFADTPMQRVMGNQARLRAMNRSKLAVQTKLAVNQPGDSFEQEADQVADRIMSMAPAPIIRRNSSSGKEEDEPQRKYAGREVETEISRKEADSGRELAPPSIQNILNSSGKPLDPTARAFMEPRFGQDFSTVRVHADEQAAESAKTIGALAYTSRNSIVFDAAQYNPHSKAGRRLLAHELTHVVQQGGKAGKIQRKPNPTAQAIEIMPGVTFTEDPAQKQIVYSFKDKPWVTIKYADSADREIDLARIGDNATQVLLTVKSPGRMHVTVDLEVEREFEASRKSLDDSAIGYDFAFRGTITLKDGALTQEHSAPARRAIHDFTTHPTNIEGLPQPEVHGHEDRWFAGNLKDTYPSFQDLAALRAYLAANPRRSFAIVRAKDGRYIARPVTGAEIQALANRARVGNFKPGNLEDIDWYKNMYQRGEFQGIWTEGQEYDDLASLRDVFFSDPETAGMGDGVGDVECEVYEMGAIDTDLGISYGRKLLSHEEAAKRWHEIDNLKLDQVNKLETVPGRLMVALHVRGVAKMHVIDRNYAYERDRFRQDQASIDAKGIDRDDIVNLPAHKATFQDYIEAQLDRETDDPEFIAELRKYRGLAKVYGTEHYDNVVEAGQRWAAESFLKSAYEIRDFVTDDKKLTQWVLSGPQRVNTDLSQTLEMFDMMDDSLSWYNALSIPEYAIAIAAGGAGNGKTLETIRNKILQTAKKMDDAAASIGSGDIIAIKQEGPFGEAVRKGVYKQYGYKLDPAAFPYKDKLPDSHVLGIDVLGGSRSDFSSLGEQIFATQLRREVAQDNVGHWAKIIGMAVATVVLVVALNAAGAAIAGAVAAEGSVGYLAVSSLVVGLGLTAAEVLQTKIAGGEMTWGQIAEAGAWNILTAGFLGRLGFAFKDAAAVTRIAVIGTAALGLGLARFLEQHKGPVTANDLLEFFTENAIMFAAMEAASALARPLTAKAALWGRALRLGVKVQEIADFNLKVNNLIRDLGSYDVRPGEAPREQAKIETTVNELLAEQERLIKDLNEKLGTKGDAAQVKAESEEELAWIRAAVAGMKRAGFLAALKLKPVGGSQSVFTFENGPEAIQKIKDFFPGARVEPQSDGSLNVFLAGSADPILLTPADPTAKAPAPGVGKVDINRASEKDLMALPGIGKKLAQAIVATREKLGGRFATVDDLTKVPGIGTKTVANLAPLVIAEDPPSIAQRQSELSQRQRTLLDRAQRQGYSDPSIEAIKRLRPQTSTNSKTLDATEAQIAAAEKSAGVKLDATAKKALANASKRLGSDRIFLRTGTLAGVSDTQVGDALARVPKKTQALGVDQLRGVVWAHLKGVPIERFFDMAQGFGVNARNSALDIFGRLADGNVANCERVLSDMVSTPKDWDGGMFALEIARYGYGIEQIGAFEQRIQGPGGIRDIDIVLKNGLHIELKNWNKWLEYRTSLADANASDPKAQGQFLRDVANERFNPSVFDKHRYIFRYPAPETPANIKAYLRSQLEIYIRGKISDANAKLLLDAFDKTKDLVTESKARADGGIPNVPEIPKSLIMPTQPQPDDKQSPTPVQAPSQ